jgi:hypothetical protein
LELKLPEEEFESCDIILFKMLGDDSKILHEPTMALTAIPNELFYRILSETITKVRSGNYSPEICQFLYDEFGIDSKLMTFFINEAISIVRMNTLQPEEIVQIGEAYHKLAVQLVGTGQQAKDNIEPEIEINAEQAADVVMEEIDE